jgi:hypothetical protein
MSILKILPILSKHNFLAFGIVMRENRLCIRKARILSIPT